jgi:peroxiredoxin
MPSGKQRHLLEAGSHAPDFRLPRLDGGEISGSEIISAAPAALAFFKISCPVCQLTFPFLERLHQPGVLPVYGISQNDAESTREFAGRYGITFPMLLDEEERGFAVSNAFGISTVPTIFLIGQDGSISRVIEGWQKQEIGAIAGFAGVSLFRPDDRVPEAKAG